MIKPTSAPIPAIAAVDIGGTSLKGAVFTGDGTVVSRLAVPTFDVRLDAFATLKELLRSLTEGAADEGFRCESIGLASPGLVEETSGRIKFTANLGWSELPLRDLLEAEFALPVQVEHDARAAAFAERAAHPEEQDIFRNFLFIPIGTGVAAAVVTSGILVRGATGGAGEFGHIRIVANGDRCGCGQHGCMEAYASATSILTRYRQRGGSIAQSVPDIVASIKVDPDAGIVWAEAVEALAIGIASLSAVLDPARVVIGGGMSKSGESLLTPLRQAVDVKLGWRATPPIIQSALGTHAGLIGAALIAGGRSTTKNFSLNAERSLSKTPPPKPSSGLPPPFSS